MIEFEDDDPDAPEGPSDDALNRIREFFNAQKDIAKTYEEMSAAEKDLFDDKLANMQAVIDKQNIIIEGENRLSHSIQARVSLHDQTIDNIDRELKLLDKKHEAGLIDVEQYHELVRIKEREREVQRQLLAEQKKYTIGVEESVKAATDMGTQLGKVMSAYGANQVFNYDNIMSFSKALLAGKAGLIGWASKLASSGLKNFVNSVINLAFELDKTESAFRQTTGASASFAREMTNSYENVRESTVSLQQNAEAWSALRTSYTDFTMISQEARAEIGQTTAILSQLGVSAADSAKGMQVADKMLGQTGTSAAATLRDLSSLAENIGVAPAQLIAQYGQIGPSLSKLGADGSKAFKELARVSKLTGMEMQKLLAVTDKFDTFEGAATSAGKLNAALGGNFVNAMDLMMATDPAERFGMLRGALDEAGLSFDDMSYYQRKFYADSLGLDSVGDLALMMSGNMEALGAETEKTSSDYEEAAARAQEMADVQTQLKTVMQSLIPVLTPLLNLIQTFADFLSRHIDTVKLIVEWVGYAIVVYKAWMTAMMLYEKALKALGITKISDIGLDTRRILLSKKQWIADKAETAQLIIMIGMDKAKAVTTGALTAAKNALTAAQNLWTASATRATVIAAAQKVWSIIMIPLTWGLAAAQGALAGASAANVIQWVLLAAAIGLVAYALLASIHSPPLYIAIPLVALGLWLMSFALSAVAPAAAAAAIPLLGVGLAVALVGAGVALAGLGFLLLAKGMVLMFEAIEVDKIKAFTGMIATLALAALFLPYAAIGMFALGIGLLSVAFALKFIATKDLEAIALFTESLASIQSGQLLETAKAIKQVAKAMDDIPDKKALTFTTILQRVEASANAISRAGGAQAYGQATGGARSGGGGGGAAPAAAAPATNQQVTVKLELDGKLLEEKVLNIVDGKFAEAS